MAITACDGEGAEDTDTDTDTEESTALQPHLLPQSGDWTVLTSGWSNDDCNADEALTDITAVTFSDVMESSFTLTMYEGDIRLGNSVTCTHTGEDTFACDDFIHEVPIDGIDATVNMVGIPSIVLNSETDAAGQGDLSVDCTGTDCAMIAGGMPFTAFPCTTTNNWTAGPE
jgi:hypothetical protein